MKEEKQTASCSIKLSTSAALSVFSMLKYKPSIFDSK
jgi:hypothetical protein